jgi:predicted Fe-Mo cluster-binding NifX family protein
MKGSKTKVAIALFGDRISPHFGSSSKFLVVVAEEEKTLDSRLIDLKGTSPMQQARTLLSLGVEEVICGGIQRRFKEWLVSKGVAVVENQRGRFEEVLEALYGRRD